MKTWHLLLVGGFLFYLWSRRQQQEISATPPPPPNPLVEGRVEPVTGVSRPPVNLFRLATDRRFG